MDIFSYFCNLFLYFEENELEIPPDGGSLVPLDGVGCRLVRHCWFLTERGNSQRLSEDFRLLPSRLLGNLGDRILVNHVREIEQRVINFWEEDSSNQWIMFRVRIEFVVIAVMPEDHDVGWESPPRMIPADEVAIDMLEKVRVNEEEAECCSICLEDMSSEVEHRMMPCKHVYHDDCIVSWLKTSHLCPLCRFALPTRRSQITL